MIGTAHALVGTWPRGPEPAGIALVADGPGGPELRRARLAPTKAIAMAARGGVVYVADGEGLSAWRWDGSGLTLHGDPVRSPGSLTCHLALAPDGKRLAVAHNRAGIVAVHPIAADGTVLPASAVEQLVGSGPNAERQASARPHMVAWREDGELLVVDLGADRLWRLRCEGGRLRRIGEIAFPPGTGPRHLALHGSMAYVVGELSDSLFLADLERGQVLHEEPCSSRRGEDAYPSAIRIAPDGRHCYVLDRGPDTVVTFALDPLPRRVASTPSGGASPWDLELVGERMWIAHRISGEITELCIADGEVLSPTASIRVPGAVSLMRLPDGVATD